MVAWLLRSGRLAERCEDLVSLGEAPFSLLREDDASAHDDVELAALTRQRRRLVLSRRVDRGRETRGPCVV